ncbi:MAG TPA: cation transporter, partial [Bacteroidia bacterium]|nr:cation transporter [Bacteroidia bacterium]
MHHQGEHITLKVEGMDCANCALGITKKLTKSGHEDVHVDFATGETSLTLSETGSLQDVISDIEKLGYSVMRDEKKRHFHLTIAHKFWFCLFFTIPLFAGHLAFGHDSWLTRPQTQLLLCIPVFIVGILHFGKSAWRSVRGGVPNMDVLIFIGSAAAFGYSVAGMILYGGTPEVHRFLFFETSATIITLVLLGNLIEHISVRKTTLAIQELSALQPATARLITDRNGQEFIETIPANQLKKNNLILVNAGESIPADGEIISGNGTADESMITGESVPVEKQAGNSVTGGTLLT